MNRFRPHPQVKGWHKNAEKARDKERNERLAALKDNDFDKYAPARALAERKNESFKQRERGRACEKEREREREKEPCEAGKPTPPGM